MGDRSVLRQGDRDDVWSWFRGLAFLLQAIVGVLAWASLYLLFPWRGM